MSKSTKSTTNTVTNPWKAAQPALKGILSEGQDIYGSLGDPNRYVPQMQQAIQPAMDVASGASQIGTGQNYQDLYGRAMEGGAAENYLTDIAGGAGLENPHWQQMLQDTLGRASAEVNRTVSGAGRYGSGAHTGVLTDRLGQLSTAAMGNEWNRARQEQMGAITALEQAQQGRLGLQGSALQGMTGVEAQNIANQLVGGQQSLAGIGALQSAPWNDLRQWLGIAGPVGGMGSSGSSTQSSSNPAAGLGTGLALASFL